MQRETVYTNTDYEKAFRWTKADGMQDLGTLKSDNSGQSEALAIADNGRTIVGWSHNDSGKKRTFVWRWMPGADGADGRGSMYDLKKTQKIVVNSAGRQVLGHRLLVNPL